MSSNPQRKKLLLKLAAAVIFVPVIVLSLRQRLSSLWIGAFSDASCRFVCFGIPRTGNRLGNYMFYYAGVQYAAWLTGRTPCIRSASKNTPLDRVFDLDIARLDSRDRCPVYRYAGVLFPPTFGGCVIVERLCPRHAQ